MVIMREILQSSDDISANNESSLIKEGEKYTTTIQRDDHEDGQFGFSIAGGNATSATVTTTTNGNENFYISKINNQDNKNNSLAIGDRILSINGYDTANINHDQAIDIIKNGGKNVELMLYREKLANENQNSSITSITDNTIEVRFKKEIFLFVSKKKKILFLGSTCRKRQWTHGFKYCWWC